MEFLLVLFCLPLSYASIPVYYMDSQCGQAISDIQSCLVETSRALTYSNNQNCVTTYTAPEGKQLLLIIKRFLTESSDGTCYDYLDIYDGPTVNSPAIATRLCGELTDEPEYNTTGQSITLQFKSDESAKDRGYAIFLLPFTTGGCSLNEFHCSARDICIDATDSLCNDYDHCGDKSDEADCTGAQSVTNNTAAYSQIGLFVGIGLGCLAIICILIFVGRTLYKKHKWNQYLKQLYGKKNLVEATSVEAAYPVTMHYQTDELINKTRAEREAALADLKINSKEDREELGSSTSISSSVLSDEVASPEPKTSTPVQPETNSVSEPPEEKENESAATLQKEDNSRSEIECYDNEALIMYDEEPLKQVPTTEL